MLTIQLEVSEDLAEKVGLETLVERFKQDMELEKLRLLAKKIQEGIQSAGLENDLLVKKARHKAWHDFKNKNLKEVLL